MVFTGNVTTDRGFIQKWVEDRSGWPALLPASQNQTRPALYIGFSSEAGSGGLTKISWDEFFKHFEQYQLAFLYRNEEGSEDRTPAYLFL